MPRPSMRRQPPLARPPAPPPAARRRSHRRAFPFAFLLFLLGLGLLPLGAPAAAQPALESDLEAARQAWHEARQRFEAAVAPLELPGDPDSDRTGARPTGDAAGNPALEGALRDLHASVPAPAHGQLREILQRPPEAWTPAELAQVRGWVVEGEASLAILTDLLGGEAGRDDLSLSLPASSSSMGPYLELLRAGRLLRAQAAWHHQGDRPGKALESLRALGTLARNLAAEPSFLSQMIAAALEGSLLRSLEWWLTAAPAVAASFKGLPQLLEGPSVDQRLRTAMAFEAGLMVGHFRTAAPSDRGAVPLAGSVTMPSREAMSEVQRLREAAAFLERFQAFVQVMRRPFPEALEALESFPESAVDPEQAPVTGVVLPLLLPNFIDGVGKLQAAGTLRLLARQALALRLRGLETGAYPVRWEEALGEVARIRDPLTGSAATWEVFEDGSARLSHPQAEAVWEERWGDLPIPPPPFSWSLPAPRGP